MTREFLNDDDVSARIKEITDERSPQIVRRKHHDASLAGAL